MKRTKTAAEILTGVKGCKKAVRLNVVLPEDEFRFLYSILTEYEDDRNASAVSLIRRLLAVMGPKIDRLNG